MNVTSPVAAYFEARKRYLDVQAIVDLPERMRQMQELTRERERCFHRLMEVAESGDPEVWYALGDACQMARGTLKDHTAALLWYQRAAESGHPKAMVSLGRCLERSESVDDKKRAIVWYRVAAEKGDPSGMIWLGFAYREGSGVSADYEETVGWFIKAVEAGDGHSMIHVGRMYAGYLNSPSKALPWLLRAAEAGFTESHVALGMLYDDRKSDIYEPTEAVRWWHVVAEGKSSSVGRAMVALAQHYRDGNGTNCDTQAAKEWLQKTLQTCTQKSEFYREAAKLLRELGDDLL